MRRIILLLAVLFPVSVLAQVDAVNGYCNLGASRSVTNRELSTNYMQGIVPVCTVTVYLAGTTTPATIYSDGAHTSLANPFKSGFSGQWLFYATDAVGVDIVLSGGSYPNFYATPVTIKDVIPGGRGGTGTVTSFSAGNLSPLFTTSVTAGSTTPALSFILSSASANTVFGNFTGSSAIPAFSATPSFSGLNITALNATQLTSGTVPVARLSGIPNVALTNSSLTLGSTNVALGATATSLAGLSVNGVTLNTSSGVNAFLNGSGSYAAPFTLTTTGSSGASTFTGGILNIPQYSGGAGGFPIILGSTSIASGSTTTAVTGLSVNGVSLSASSGATTFLNGAGAYTGPFTLTTIGSSGAATLIGLTLNIPQYTSGGGGGGTPGSPGGSSQFNVAGSFGGSDPFNAATFGSVQAAVNNGTPTMIPVGTTGAYTQNNALPATATCTLDNSTGLIAMNPLALGVGYVTGTSYSVSYSTLPAGASLGTITTTTANSLGQITGYTISGANSFPAMATALTGCPITFTVASPPAAAAPVPIINYNNGLTTFSPVYKLDDFGCAADGTTDDTQCFNNAAAYATNNGTQLGTVEATGGKNYHFSSVTGSYKAGFDDGVPPIAAQLAITVSGGSLTGCSVSTAGQFLNSTQITVPSGDTGGTITATLNTSTHVVSSCTASGTTSAAGNFTATAGPLCVGSICTILPPIANYMAFSGRIPNLLTIEGNGATFSGGFNIAATTGACVHITAWSVSGGTGTFTYSAPNCTLTSGEGLVLEGFPTTVAFNGQAVTVNAGVTSGSFSATVAGVTGSASEIGSASTFTSAFPYVAILGSENPAVGVTISNLFLQNGFIGIGNFGSGNTLSSVICTYCGIYLQGQNAQNDKVDLAGASGARANVSAGLVLGGQWVTRSPFNGIESGAAVNSFDLFDGMQFTNSEFFYNRTGSAGTVAQQNELREGFDCIFDQKFMMLEGTGLTNPEHCWNPPGGVVRMTDQDIASLPYPDFMSRGIFGVGFAGYTMYGRPSNGVTISQFFSENEPNYSVVIGPNNAALKITGLAEELGGVCADNVTLYGDPACPNLFEPQNPVLQSAVLTNNHGTFDTFSTVNVPQSISGPWQNLPIINNYLYNIPDQFVVTNTNAGYNGSTGNPIRNQNTNNPATINQLISGSLLQADGAQLNTGSPITSVPMQSYRASAFRSSTWNSGDISQLFATSANQPPTLYLADPTIVGTALQPSTVLVNGLRVSPNPAQGGNIKTIAMATGGSGYPFNIPVTVSVQPSPANTPGSATSFYIPQCMATASSAGVVNNISCGLLGAGYASAPSVIVNKPGGATFSCTTTTPSSGIPSTCQVINQGTGITSCSVTTAYFSGSGATFTPTCANGQATAMTVSGGTGFPNFFYVFVGTNGGTQATATTTVNSVDPQAQIEHFEKCVVNSASGVTVASGSTATLAGLTGTCSNLIYLGASNRTDYLLVPSIPGFVGHGGLGVVATPTATNTISIALANTTSASITVPAGTYPIIIMGTNSFNDTVNPSAVTPTVTTAPSFPVAIIGTTTIALGSTVPSLAGLTSISTGSGATACGSATSCFASIEASTAGTPTSGQDYIRADSVTHSWLQSVNGGAETALSGGGGGSTAWNGITNPTGNQSLSMGTNTSAWTWGISTASSTNLFTVTDGNSTGTGSVAFFANGATSNLHPFTVKAGSNGTPSIDVNSSGGLNLIGGTIIGGNLTINGTDAATLRVDTPLTITFSTTLIIPITRTVERLTLTGNVTSSTIAAGADGQRLCLDIAQNGTGGFTLAFPTNIHGHLTIPGSQAASLHNLQCFQYSVAATAWLAESGGVIGE